MDNIKQKQLLREFIGDLLAYDDLNELDAYVGELDGNSVANGITGIRILHHVANGAVANAGEIAKLLVERMDADPNALTKEGDSPLHYASQYSTEPELFDYLVSVSDINMLNKHKETPMVKAVMSGNMSAVVKLANLGADVNTVTSSGKSLQELMVTMFGKEGASAWEAVTLARSAESVIITETDGKKTADIGGYIIDLSDIEASATVKQQQPRRRL